MKIGLFIALGLFIQVFASGQPQNMVDPTSFDYSKADSIALNAPKKDFKYVNHLVNSLVENLKTDHEKLRVLFRWITNNIEYSHGYKTNQAEIVLKNRRAVCAGYSSLLKEMCNVAHLQCEVIEGYSKTTIKDINRKLEKTNHAWNAVKLYGKWYLLDVTWATSYLDENTNKFVKLFNDGYYLTPPERFVGKHLPKDKKWQLMHKAITKSVFTKSFVSYNGLYERNIENLQPHKGTINLRLRDSLEIKFTKGTEIERPTIELGNRQFVYHPIVRRGENYYFIRQKFEKSGTYRLIFFIGKSAIVAYRITIKK